MALDPTDYGWDDSGNLLWIQGPQIQTSQGGIRPITRFAYDGNNNLTSYCDPQYVWSTGATTCPSASGTTRYTWNYADANEPYGYLTDVYSPTGYHISIAYTPTYEAGIDAGLPTTVLGDSITQGDGTTRRPTRYLAYNAYGDLTTYNLGNGAWSLTYDGLNASELRLH